MGIVRRYARYLVLSLTLCLFVTAVPVAAEVPDDEYWHANTSFPGSNNLIDEIVVDGDDVYVCGRFTSAGGVPINHVARFDGTDWHPLGTGLPEMALIHRVFVDGPRVYVAGMFMEVGNGIPAYNVAMWDGNAWDAMGGGTDRALRAIAKTPNGDIYAGGEFTTAGGVTARGIARWDGQQWHALGMGIDNHVSALAVIGNDVYVGGAFQAAGGQFANFIARWDGNSWHTMGGGVNGYVTALAAHNGLLYVGGQFNSAGGRSANCIAIWDGYNWQAMGSGVTGAGLSAVREITVDGNKVYVGGFFTFAGGESANYVAMWNGSSWSRLGSGTDYSVKAIERHGDKLYVGGEFLMAGGKVSNYLAEWVKPELVPVFFYHFDARARGPHVELEWHVGRDEPITGYNIYRVESGRPYEERANEDGVLPATSNHYVDENVRGGMEYRYVLAAVRPDGTEIRSPFTTVKTNQARLALDQNHPNPFNPTTTIRFVLPRSERVRLSIYTSGGHKVLDVADGVLPEGVNEVVWNGRNTSGAPVSSGIYFYRLEVGGESLTRKMILLK